MKFFLILSLMLLNSIIFCAESSEEYSQGELDRWFYTEYRPDGKFVSIPADVGNCLGLVIGSVPAAFAAGTVHFFAGAEYQALDVGGMTVRCFSYPLGFVFGLPFKFLRVVFWDAPSSFFNTSDKNEAGSYHNKQ
ncbi:MAG: hypothetical protein PHV75_00720 [Victivallaceae bacterium]|jgi:hypothetical protein|nr:hypothetical protein [Victivallaceae bacterium]NLK84206.1 hypothetical protein [Lentisphaerota bacterium]MDD3115897.1 hypothetical protein [Victivallaceae bacterium]MDD3704261.1 hypothetical protein [Victivallaceae bacterium]MDD4317020.1 hypothetical protein [Victivallaceae bacterium]